MTDLSGGLDQHALEESADDIFEGAPCGYLFTAPDGTIIKANATFLAWTGFTREDLARKRFRDLLTLPGRIYHDTHYGPLLHMQRHVEGIAFDMLRADDSEFPVLLNTVQKQDNAGNTLWNRTTVFNASERRQYERELLVARRRAEDSARVTADLLAMLGHDIRTPLNSISLNAHILQLSGLTEQQQACLGRIRSASANMLELIDNVLDYSRNESQGRPLSERVMSIADIVDAGVAAVQPQADAKNVRVITRIDAAATQPLLGDPVKLGQVVTNLLGNAVKFTAVGEVSITVGVSEAREHHVILRVEVADTGIGIEADQQARIFESYAQASAEIGRRYGGSGLGLAISRRLLELHGSTLSVASEPGKGSVFSFTVKLRMAPGPAA